MMAPLSRAVCLAVGMLLAVLLASAQSSATTLPKLPSLFGGSFALSDHDGRAVTDQDFRGRYMLVGTSKDRPFVGG
jgi:cytochrome oxidase Cu insertion factor (SCO1/SenC/PrrC family)